ncbi:hypothetical protein AGMMS50262_20470 [Bacteroidia bacterium]|nr:hypothetical protein AGMMS50262_20470 [Bacteroidia bacterium]
MWVKSGVLRLLLPEGAELFIFNRDLTMVYGHVTAAQNTKDYKFQTDLVAGDTVTIRISEYSIFQSAVSANTLSCHKDVNCYTTTWGNESDAVGLMLVNGNAFCTGALLNTTYQTSILFIVGYPMQRINSSFT